MPEVSWFPPKNWQQLPFSPSSMPRGPWTRRGTCVLSQNLARRTREPSLGFRMRRQTPTLGLRHRFRNFPTPPPAPCCHLPAPQCTWLRWKEGKFKSCCVGWSVWAGLKDSKEHSLFSQLARSRNQSASLLCLVCHCRNSWTTHDTPWNTCVPRMSTARSCRGTQLRGEIQGKTRELRCGSAEANPTSIREVAGLVPGLS